MRMAKQHHMQQMSTHCGRRDTFLTPPVAGALLRAAFVASCLRGALPPVDLRAVCFVRAMATSQKAEDQQDFKAFRRWIVQLLKPPAQLLKGGLL